MVPLLSNFTIPSLLAQKHRLLLCVHSSDPLKRLKVGKQQDDSINNIFCNKQLCKLESITHRPATTISSWEEIIECILMTYPPYKSKTEMGKHIRDLQMGMTLIMQAQRGSIWYPPRPQLQVVEQNNANDLLTPRCQ